MSVTRKAAAALAAIACLLAAAGCSSPSRTLAQGSPSPSLVSPAPAPTVAPEAGDDSLSGAPAPTAAQEVAGRAVGLTEDAAAALARSQGVQTRVVSRDGTDLPATADYRTDRVDLWVVGGLVTAARVG